MLKIGVTGGIGSGKSTVSKRLAEHGAFVVDADQIAREIVEPGQPALQELSEAFTDVLLPDGTLNRGELAKQAFATTEATTKLNAITHPRIRERTQQLFAQAESAGESVLVYDMPLLIENGEYKSMDHVVVVDVPDEVRVQRLVEFRGLVEADARARIAAQIDRQSRLDAADTVLDNSGTVEDLLEQVDRFWENVAR
ncbi:dephospho-CoA kinase [Corynebacterium suicordis]|uniref:Dephospho-CoA kinase n=1 Tax=Corynebacterium suicordis DSM 45110 TaxID=1121369 RepID=A0ABR9ZJW7_9CORY|nr:dephospho-CoA kinase [Corynebacterium suicordis]MBF4553730.1 dephospho-CoA kinase [Corynebacterium suicordis DSM 45110]MDR6277293.1 dephospho-CoA kinase [Corynebacterium suicordis]